MELKYGKYSVMPFASIVKAKKFAIKAHKKNYVAEVKKRNGVYLVIGRKIIRRGSK